MTDWKAYVLDRSIPEPNSGCWLWTASWHHLGYGAVGRHPDHGQVKAHRLSWVAFNGTIPDGLKVCHKCDVRCCVNPDHLFLGTQADNVADMFAKGRNRSSPRYGEENPMAVLTENKAREILRTYAGGVNNQRELCRMYNVTPMTMNRLVRRISWRTIEM